VADLKNSTAILPAEQAMQVARIAGTGNSFLSQLSHADLLKLRKVVKLVHLQYQPDGCTDREADKIIEAMGPETMEKWLQAAIVAKADL
jgi:hypothetical protein